MASEEPLRLLEPGSAEAARSFVPFDSLLLRAAHRATLCLVYLTSREVRSYSGSRCGGGDGGVEGNKYVYRT